MKKSNSISSLKVILKEIRPKFRDSDISQFCEEQELINELIKK